MLGRFIISVLSHILLLLLSLLMKFRQLQEVGAILGCRFMFSIYTRVVLCSAKAASSLFYPATRISTTPILL